MRIYWPGPPAANKNAIDGRTTIYYKPYRFSHGDVPDFPHKKIGAFLEFSASVFAHGNLHFLFRAPPYFASPARPCQGFFFYIYVSILNIFQQKQQQFMPQSIFHKIQQVAKLFYLGF